MGTGERAFIFFSRSFLLRTAPHYLNAWNRLQFPATELLEKVFSFLCPSLQNKNNSLCSRDCCARRNLILGGGAHDTSGEASRLCSRSSRSSGLDRSPRQLRRLNPYHQLQVHISPSPNSMLLRPSY